MHQLHFLYRTNYNQEIPQFECENNPWNRSHDWISHITFGVTFEECVDEVNTDAQQAKKSNSFHDCPTD
eukprot:07617.XXX_393269_393472_1 [CDS] Oithona nana genome sequencing.